MAQFCPGKGGTIRKYKTTQHKNYRVSEKGQCTPKVRNEVMLAVLRFSANNSRYHHLVTWSIEY